MYCHALSRTDPTHTFVRLAFDGNRLGQGTQHLREPRHHLFSVGRDFRLLGDNRDDSRDSRDWGFLDKKWLRGKSMTIYWSWAPDPNAPKWESPYFLPLLTIPGYNISHFHERIRWERLFMDL